MEECKMQEGVSKDKLVLTNDSRVIDILRDVTQNLEDLRDIATWTSLYTNTHIETSDERWVYEQSESIYWDTCMSKDWKDDRQFRTQCLPEDVEVFRKGYLFFWTIGKPKSVDKKGFEVRAKLRLVTKDGKGLYEPVSKGSDVWLLLDTIYPHERWHALLQSMDELKTWFSDYCEEHEFVMKGRRSL
jgi:hypothetical protein